MLIINASPRVQGNCETASNSIALALEQSCRTNVRVEHLRNYSIIPCSSCGSCEKAAQQYVATHANAHETCPYIVQDTSNDLFTSLLTCTSLCIVAPIYFYHLPASFKALIDRLQPFWFTGLQESAIPSPKPCYVVLIAGRPQGEQLFTGALLSIKYAFRLLHFTVQEPLLLRGLDARRQLAESSTGKEQLTNYIQYMMQISG